MEKKVYLTSQKDLKYINVCLIEHPYLPITATHTQLLHSLEIEFHTLPHHHILNFSKHVFF